MSKTGIFILLLVTAVLGSFAFVQSRRSSRLIAQLQAEEAKQASTVAELENRDSKIKRLEEDAGRLKRNLEELSSLRGEVARLQAEKAEMERRLAAVRRSVNSVPSPLEAGQLRPEALVDGPAQREILLAEAPSPVRLKVAQQYPDASFDHLVQMDDDGRTLYFARGSTADDRRIEVVLNENGDVLEQQMDVRFTEVPDLVQRSLARQVGIGLRDILDEDGMEMRQVWDNGKTTYWGDAEQKGQKWHFTFSETGELIRYETWAEKPEPEQTP